MNTPKWGNATQSPIVAEFHEYVRGLVAKRAESLGVAWSELAGGRTMDLLDASDLEELERIKLATGYRFDVGATVSAKESPEKYKPLAGAASAVAAEAATQRDSDAPVAVGDNVRQGEDLEGTVMRVRTIEQVFELLTTGVPPESVALIDDSGGTLTAPILNQFAAILCLGGTVRSHLAILSREYAIPCLMNVKLDGPLESGDRVRVEYSAPAMTAAAYDEASGTQARVWQLSGAQDAEN